MLNTARNFLLVLACMTFSFHYFRTSRSVIKFCIAPGSLLFIGIPSTFEILACFKSVVYHTGHNEKCDGHIKQDEVSVSQLQNSLQPNIFLSCISVSHASFQPSSSSVPFKLSQSFFLIPKYEKLHRNLNRLDLWKLD